MDPSLQKQREAFLQRAKAHPIVGQGAGDSRVSEIDKFKQKRLHKKRKLADGMPSTNAQAGTAAAFNIKAAKVSSPAVFGTLAKIIDYMKKRHLNQQTWALSLNEILEEVQVHDLSKRSIFWLSSEALANNRRITTEQDDETGETKYVYKPPYKIKGKQSLLNVLKKHDLEGKGAILLSELNDCVMNGEKIIQSMNKTVVDVPTQVNKRKDHAYFFNDLDANFTVDEEFQSLWRNVSVDHLDEKKIEEYLQKHGIDIMRDLAPKKTVVAPKRKTPRRKIVRVQNEHLVDLLEKYDDKSED